MALSLNRIIILYIQVFNYLLFHFQIGETYPLPKGRVLTGITIASKSNPLTLYFGCYSEDHGSGGLGVLQISATHSGISRTLKPVTSNGQPVYGGALFLVEDREKLCNNGDDDNMCPNSDPCYCASNSSASELKHERLLILTTNLILIAFIVCTKVVK